MTTKEPPYAVSLCLYSPLTPCPGPVMLLRFLKIYNLSSFLFVCLFVYGRRELVSISSFQSVIPRPIASPFLRELTEMRILRLYSRPIESETLGMGPSNCFLMSSQAKD